jgi:hypothetical protein
VAAAVRELLVLQAQPAEVMVVQVLHLLFLDLLLLMLAVAAALRFLGLVEQVAQAAEAMVDHKRLGQMVVQIPVVVVEEEGGLVDRLAEMVDLVL